MRPTDAKQVLARLFGAYRATLDEAAVAAYATGVADLELDVALEAVADLIRSDEHLPTVKRLRDAYRIADARLARQRARTALPPAKPRNWQAVQLDGVRRAKAALAATSEQPTVRLEETAATA